MEQELAYSFHLGSDKNRKKSVQNFAGSTVSNSTSLSNNAIQNAQQLSKVCNHNLRNYDNERELINVIYGTYDLENDVKNTYLIEFEGARLEYNSKQTRKDRLKGNYFEEVSNDGKKDLACEIIIELGDMNFWQDKEYEYRHKMIEVYQEQLLDLQKIVPAFKISNAVVHFDESSPHMHIVGVPVKEKNKTGMKKQVGKSTVFTKESLTIIQDKMRECCIKSFNRVYEQGAILKQKKKGRNQDFKSKDMAGYSELKKEQEKNAKSLKEANSKSDKLKDKTDEIMEILDNLKSAPFSKNNSQISNEDVDKIKNYAKDVKDTTKSIKGVNDLNVTIENVEKNYKDLVNERDSLYYSNKEKDEIIADLKDEIKVKTERISKLESALDRVKIELSKFKEFWRKLIKRFQIKVFDEKIDNIPEDKRNYTIVADDLINSGIFDDNDANIIHEPTRKVLTNEELAEIQAKKGKKKNDYNLN